MIGNLLAGFIVVVVGVNLLAPIADSVYLSTHNSSGGTSAINLSSAGVSILSLVTLLYALGIMTAGMAIAVQGLKNAGVM